MDFFFCFLMAGSLVGILDEDFIFNIADAILGDE
jgi:hypothetical protein